METTERLCAPETLSVLDGDVTSGKLVCFVCTGNTCRSPMAEAYMKSRGFEAISRGIAAYEGDPISPLAVLALKDGVSVRHHDGRDTDSSMGRKR